MDFPVSFDLFRWITGAKAGDYGLYQIQAEGISALVQHKEDEGAEDARITKKVRDAYALAFPTTAAQLIEWSVRTGEPLDHWERRDRSRNRNWFARKWFAAIVAAKSEDDALALLGKAKKSLARLIDCLERKADAMPKTKPYEPRIWVVQETGKRRDDLAAIEAIEEAICGVAGRFQAWRDETRRELAAHGLAADAIDFSFGDSRLRAQFDRILPRLDWLPSMLRETDTAKAITELERIAAAADNAKHAEGGPVGRMPAHAEGSPEHLVARLERDALFVVENVARDLRGAMYGKRDNERRDGLIAKLRARGIANTPIGYADFLKLTTFTPGPESGYALRKDECGNAVGLEATEDSFPLEHETYHGTEAATWAAEHRENARLPSFPQSAEWVVSWVWRQAGAVQIAAPNSEAVSDDDWIEAVARVAASQVATPHPPATNSAQPHAKPRKNNGIADIIEVLNRIGATRESNPKELENAVRRGLLEDASKGENGTLPGTFRNFSGQLQAFRADRWSNYDRQALTKRIRTALTKLP